jgi:hypothetical protein
VVAVGAGVRLPASKELVGARPFARPQLRQLPQPPLSDERRVRVGQPIAANRAPRHGSISAAGVCEVQRHERPEPGASASSLERRPLRGVGPPG